MISPMLLAASFPNIPLNVIVIGVHPIPMLPILLSGMTASSCPPSQIFARIPPGRAFTIPPSASLGIVGRLTIFTPIADAPIFATLFAMVMTKFILSIIQFIELTMVFLTASHTEVTVHPITVHIAFHATLIGSARRLKVSTIHFIHALTSHFMMPHALLIEAVMVFHTATMSIPILLNIIIVIPATSAAPNENTSLSVVHRDIANILT